MSKQERKEAFKQFVRAHPRLKAEVDRGDKTWRALFDEWELFGEDDPMWDAYAKTPKNSAPKEETVTTKEGSDSGIVSQLTSMVKNMDGDQMNQHLESLNRAIGAVQGILGQFQGSKPTETRKSTEPSKKNPFSFRQD